MSRRRRPRAAIDPPDFLAARPPAQAHRPPAPDQRQSSSTKPLPPTVPSPLLSLPPPSPCSAPSLASPPRPSGPRPSSPPARPPPSSPWPSSVRALPLALPAAAPVAPRHPPGVWPPFSRNPSTDTPLFCLASLSPLPQACASRRTRAKPTTSSTPATRSSSTTPPTCSRSRCVRPPFPFPLRFATPGWRLPRRADVGQGRAAQSWPRAHPVDGGREAAGQGRGASAVPLPAPSHRTRRQAGPLGLGLRPPRSPFLAGRRDVGVARPEGRVEQAGEGTRGEEGGSDPARHQPGRPAPSTLPSSRPPPS